jgi:peroxiredoxin
MKSNFTFLSDTEGVLLDELNIRHRRAPGVGDIAFPTALLVDSNGIVRWTYETDTYRTRARPEDVLRAIGGLAGGPA